MKVVLLAGGFGSWINGESIFKKKKMIVMENEEYIKKNNQRYNNDGIN